MSSLGVEVGGSEAVAAVLVAHAAGPSAGWILGPKPLVRQDSLGVATKVEHLSFRVFRGDL
jgi:hypothetical protein